MNRKLVSFTNVAVLCLIVFVVSGKFIHNADLIGVVLIILSGLCLISLKLFRVAISSTYPDIIFGLIDNGVLAIFAVFGGSIAGTAGAVIGGVVGNAITDGIAGMFEGYWSEIFASGTRTVLGSAVGKMAGCLLGAGIVLILVNFV